jgi:hypothetical protein
MLMYDAVPDGVHAIPADAQAVAGYVDGSYVSFPLLVHRFYPNAHCISICISPDGIADFLDVEPGNPTTTREQVRHSFENRKAHGVWKPGFYAGRNEIENLILPALAGIPRDEYRLWLAEWDYVAHCPKGYEACQFTNNKQPDGRDGPYDTSLIGNGFFRTPVKKPSRVKAAAKKVAKKAIPAKPHPKVAASSLAAAVVAALSIVLKAEGVHVDPSLSHAIEAVAAALAGYVVPSPKSAS